MPKSIKLSNDTYFDISGIVDANRNVIDTRIIYDWGFDNTSYFYYIRFNDGTMIIYGFYSIGALSPNNPGYNHTITLEKPFINNQYSVFTTKRMGGAANFSQLVDSVDVISASEFKIITWLNDGNFDGGLNSYMAIGKWK